MPRKIPPRQIFPPRGYHHGNLRAALLEAGLQLIEENGIRALTLREIGNRAGVSRTAAYRHFSSKADLLLALSKSGFEQFAQALENAREQALPKNAARLIAMAEAYVRFATEHRAHFQVMFAASGEGPPATEEAARAFAILEKTILEGQQSGEIRAGDSKILAYTAWSLVHGISALNLEVPGISGQEDSRSPERTPQNTSFTYRAAELLLTGLSERTNRGNLDRNRDHK